jgi:two-component system sensor histidine kinase/response regulator
MKKVASARKKAKARPTPRAKSAILYVEKEKRAVDPGLRRLAEKKLALRPKRDVLSGIDALKLVHELQVHQTELEMQNEELKRAATAVDESRARYSDLYDFAPVGYITLDDKGIVLEANLAIARMTGYERGVLLKKPFQSFVFPEDKNAFLFYSQCLVSSDAKTTFDIRLARKDRSIFYAQIVSTVLEDTVKSGRQFLLSVQDFTERREAELALEESEKNYRQLVELAQEGIWAIDANGLTTFVNPAMAHLLGYASEAMIGKSLFDFRDERESAVTKESLERRKRGITERRDMELIHADGSRLYTTMAASPILDEKGEYLGAIAVITDISKRKLMEDAIRHNEARLESLLKISQYQATSNQDLLDFALNEAIVLTKSKIGYIYRYDDTKKEFTLDTWSQGVMEECSISEKQTVYQLEKTGIWGEAVRQARPIIVNDFHAQNPLKKGYPEGHSKLNSFLTVPVFIQSRIVGVVGVANNETGYTDDDSRQLTLLMNSAWTILERKSMEERLRVSEKQYRNLFESMDEGFALCEMIYDEAGKPIDFRYIEVNPAFARVAGLPPERVIGRRVKEVIPGIEPFWIETYGRIVESGRSERIDNPVAELGKHFELYAWRSPSGPNRFAVVFNDVTERMHAEKLLRIQAEELAFANKELEAFGFSVSHDLRSPLHSIGVCCAVISKDPETVMGKNSKVAFGHILQTTQRMSEVITDLLALSRITRQEIRREPANLSDMVHGFYSELKSFAPDRSIEFVIEPDCIARADSGLVRILIENLVRNAWKYTAKTSKAHIEFGARKGEGQTFFFIKDNGVGFDMNDADKLFRPFHRLHSDKDFKGTGIGLAIVKRIVDKHHGLIRAEAEKDKGATFYFRLE